MNEATTQVVTAIRRRSGGAACQAGAATARSGALRIERFDHWRNPTALRMNATTTCWCLADDDVEAAA
ncbi:hypothetical protein [Haloechinothrix sp. LS1_15]|uniref:hypothetical protein n=1 Tax=Haloechinothrix sp. LS1_15 TaxID=2652248 RepID=UPI002943FF29|nr:hypothetical protein [Haloechinothrix sp. LS1_15]MDV6011617.1 hypothetical protein [Haloechinothrix sp. LS1_15]